jgi:hypothetical protein
MTNGNQLTNLSHYLILYRYPCSLDRIHEPIPYPILHSSSFVSSINQSIIYINRRIIMGSILVVTMFVQSTTPWHHTTMACSSSCIINQKIIVASSACPLTITYDITTLIVSLTLVHIHSLAHRILSIPSCTCALCVCLCLYVCTFHGHACLVYRYMYHDRGGIHMDHTRITLYCISLLKLVIWLFHPNRFLKDLPSTPCSFASRDVHQGMFDLLVQWAKERLTLGDSIARCIPACVASGYIDDACNECARIDMHWMNVNGTGGRHRVWRNEEIEWDELMNDGNITVKQMTDGWQIGMERSLHMDMLWIAGWNDQYDAPIRTNKDIDKIICNNNNECVINAYMSTWLLILIR